MTFIVNQDGVVYEKDLGPQTGTLAKMMDKFNPDKVHGGFRHNRMLKIRSHASQGFIWVLSMGVIPYI